jgi:hypothetical protein
VAAKCSYKNAWFVTAAGHMSWDVYCAVLPGGWSFVSATASYDNGGLLLASYKGSGGATFKLEEGNFCPPPDGCAMPTGAVIGDGYIGLVPATLVHLAGGGYTLFATPSTYLAYAVTGKGMAKSTFLSLSAALLKVAKP